MSLLKPRGQETQLIVLTTSTKKRNFYTQMLFETLKMTMRIGLLFSHILLPFFLSPLFIDSVFLPQTYRPFFPTHMTSSFSSGLFSQLIHTLLPLSHNVQYEHSHYLISHLSSLLPSSDSLSHVHTASTWQLLFTPHIKPLDDFFPFPLSSHPIVCPSPRLHRAYANRTRLLILRPHVFLP